MAKFASIGNKLDLDEVDFLEYYGKDPETKIIGMYLESVTRGRELIETIAKIQKSRPNALLTRTFFDAKGDEIVSVFSDGPKIDVTKLVETLNRISPLNSQKWNKIR